MAIRSSLGGGLGAVCLFLVEAEAFPPFARDAARTFRSRRRVTASNGVPRPTNVAPAATRARKSHRFITVPSGQAAVRRSCLAGAGSRLIPDSRFRIQDGPALLLRSRL